MGEEVWRFVRDLEALAVRSGKRIVELRVSDREAARDVTVTFEKMETTVDGRVGTARRAAAARYAAPDVAAEDFGVRADAHAGGDGVGAHDERADPVCRSNEWVRPGRLPQRRARGKRSGAAPKRRKRSGAAEEHRKRMWVAQSFRRTRARNLIVAAVRQRAAQLLVAARERAKVETCKADDDEQQRDGVDGGGDGGLGERSYSKQNYTSAPFQSNGEVDDDGGSGGSDGDETCGTIETDDERQRDGVDGGGDGGLGERSYSKQNYTSAPFQSIGDVDDDGETWRRDDAGRLSRVEKTATTTHGMGRKGEWDDGEVYRFSRHGDMAPAKQELRWVVVGWRELKAAALISRALIKRKAQSSLG